MGCDRGEGVPLKVEGTRSMHGCRKRFGSGLAVLGVVVGGGAESLGAVLMNARMCRFQYSHPSTMIIHFDLKIVCPIGDGEWTLKAGSHLVWSKKVG